MEQPTKNIEFKTILWETITETNADGAAFEGAAYRDRSVQVVGTFGGTTASLQGSNDGVNWVNLTTPAGAALTFAAAGIKAVGEFTRYVRPFVTGGTGVDLDFYMTIGGNNA